MIKSSHVAEFSNYICYFSMMIGSECSQTHAKQSHFELINSQGAECKPSLSSLLSFALPNIPNHSCITTLTIVIKLIFVQKILWHI